MSLSLPSALARALTAAWLLAAAATAQPNLTPTSFLPGDDAIGLAAGDQEEPAMAFGGGQYLVAWTDWRTDRTGTLLLDQAGSDIYAARVAADGSLIDTTPIAISLDAGNQNRPQVSWNGTNFLVTWTSQEPTQFYWAAAVHGVRVSPQGQVLDAQPIEILTYPFSTSVFFNAIGSGSDWLVIGQGTSSGESDVVGRRVSAQGTLLDPTPKVLVSSSTSLVFNISLAYSNGTYLLAWTDTSVRARRFDAQLNTIGGVLTIASFGSGVSGAGAAGNANGFFVVFGQYTSGNQLGRVYGARVGTNGVNQDPGGFLIKQESLLSQPEPRVTWDGTNWITSWKPNSFLSSEGLLAARVTTAGQILDPGGVSVKANPNAEYEDPELVGKATGGAQIVWADRRSPGPFPLDIYTSSVDGQLQPGVERGVSMGAPRQTGSDVVWNGQSFLAVYKSETSTGQRILAQRISPAGSAIDLQPVQVVAPQAALLGAPRVDWNGSEYLVAFGQGKTLRAIRLDASLAPLDPAPFDVMPISGNTTADVAALGADFLVVGVNNPTQEHVVSVFGRRVSAAGALLDPAPVVLGASYAVQVRTIALGGRWLVVYRRNATHDNPFGYVYASFMDASGGTQPTFPVHSPSTSGLQGVDVVEANGAAMVCWREPVGEGDIYAKRVTSTGQVLDGPSGLPIVAAPGDQFGPAIGYDGSEILVAHEDQRQVTFFLDERSDVYGGRLDAALQALDPAGFPIHTDAELPEVETAVAGANGRHVVLASILRSDAPYAGYRVGVRVAASCFGSAVAHGAGCAGTGGVVPKLELLGCPTPGGVGQLVISGGVGGGSALLFFGVAPASLPMAGGCQLLVAPLLPLLLNVPLSGSGAGAGQAILPFSIAPGAPTGQIGMQAFVVDPGGAAGFANSNGLMVTVQ